MKKIFFILTITAIVCCSCWKTGYYKNNRYEIYSSWYTSVKTILNENVDFAFISNAWINGNDSVRRIIEDNYLPYRRIRHEGGNEYGIYNGANLILTINTGGKKIDDPDANWLITRYGNYDIIEVQQAMPTFLSSNAHSRMSISNMGGNAWRVNLDSASHGGSTSNWTSTADGTETPIHLMENDFSLEGSGVFMYEGTSFDGTNSPSPVTMQYTFTEPMKHNHTATALFSYGKVDFLVTKEGCDDIRFSEEIRNGNTSSN